MRLSGSSADRGPFYAKPALPPSAVLAAATVSTGRDVEEIGASFPIRLQGTGLGKLRLHYGDSTDGATLIRIFQRVLSDEVRNLAAQSLAATQECGCQ